MRKLAHPMQKIYKKKIPDEKLPDIIPLCREEYYGKTYQDSEKRIPDISKMKSVSWEPKYNLIETFELSMDYYIDKY